MKIPTVSLLIRKEVLTKLMGQRFLKTNLNAINRVGAGGRRLVLKAGGEYQVSACKQVLV